MGAMVFVGGIIVVLSIVFVMLLVMAVASRRFRGLAIGLMLMSLVGGTAFLVLTYVVALNHTRRVQAERASAEVARQQLLSEQSLADEYREGIILDGDSEASVIVTPESAEIADPADMAVEPPTTAVEAPTTAVEPSEPVPTGEEEAAVTPDTPANLDTTQVDESTVAEPNAVTSVSPSVEDDAVMPEDYKVERPAWVKNPPQWVDGSPAEVILSDAFVTGDECEQNLNSKIAAAIQRLAEEQSRVEGGPHVEIHVSPEDIRRVSRDRHLEIIKTSVGPMKQIHQLVVFDNEFKRRAKAQMTEAVVGTRLAATGAVSGGALILLATSFALLRIVSRSSRDAST